MNIERRDPGMVVLFSVLTCGFYLVYWYAKMYEELTLVGGNTPTGNSFFLDLVLSIITCTLYGIWVDYKISQQFNEIYAARGLPANDTSNMIILCDVAAYFFGGLTNIIGSAIHQDQLNKVVASMSAPAPTPVAFR